MLSILRRFVFAPALAALLAPTLVALAAIAPARAAEPGVVFAALDVLTQRHVASPDPVKLLDAAVDGLRQALFRVGIAVQLANVNAADGMSARRDFQNQFERAVAAGQRTIGSATETVLQYFATGVMAASLEDSHTWFATPDQWQELLRRQRGEASYSGLGLRLRPQDGGVYVIDVYPEGPAGRAGLRIFDRVVGLDGRATAGMTLPQVFSRLRGPQGASVSVTVRRPGQTDPLTVPLVHAPIVIPTLDHRMLDGSIGYIKFRQFIQGSSAEFARSLEDLVGTGMRRLILDLRGNLGGSDQELGAIASMFLPPGLPVAVLRDRQGARVDLNTAGGPRLPQATVVTVLIDQDTVSAGEVLAAAFQEHARGMVVGRRSAGRVGFGGGFALPGGAGIVVTIRTVATGRDIVLEKQGVRPDVPVELTTADFDRGIDGQLQRAVQPAALRIGTRHPIIARR